MPEETSAPLPVDPEPQAPVPTPTEAPADVPAETPAFPVAEEPAPPAPKVRETEPVAIKTKPGASVKRFKEPKKNCPVEAFANQILVKSKELADHIKDGNKKGYGSLVTDGFYAKLESHHDRPSRFVFGNGPYAYVVVEAVDLVGRTPFLEARLYAHIPPEINNMVVPWLKELGVRFSDQTMIRPSAL